MKIIDFLKHKTKLLKRELRVLSIAYKKPGVPWYTKTLAAIVIGYALSPVDLIPDFIPVLGYLDDLLLIPLGIYMVIKLIPKNVLEECRIEAENAARDDKPKNWIAGFIILAIWIFIIGLIIYKYIL
ncbi:YkvA family protein [Clostridium swellfunianum]|uniref:YkvA family protein n=1 Tax=Clostridium swellfunianum TaxID=1367462 RepID=UPI00202EB9D9|nr:YkvA family protein [Clostridium swellfunianum]MCM0650837.1 YkvA family protein [Clostridium swellfunianum]